jgi:hypothetical protein
MDSIIILEPNGVNEMNSVFKLYPNPANDVFTISSTDKLSDVHFELTDITGKNVGFSITNQSNYLKEIDISNLQKGLYFVKVFAGTKISLLKLMKN